MGHNVLDGDDLISVYHDRDLADHGTKGRPYTIVKDEEYGRHMLAARDIAAGEVVMEDTPLTYGPLTSAGVRPMCVGCYRSLAPGHEVRCRLCGWPVCGDQVHSPQLSSAASTVNSGEHGNFTSNGKISS